MDAKKYQGSTGIYTVGVDGIAAGLLEMIWQHPDRGCLVVGMLPADIMECFETNLAAKIPDAQVCRAITRDVTVAILKAATAAGVCRV